MPDTPYLHLALEGHRDILSAAEMLIGRGAFHLEMHIWDAAALGALFDTPFAEHLMLKGGTSLSKIMPMACWLDDSESFDSLMGRCSAIEVRAND